MQRCSIAASLRTSLTPKATDQHVLDAAKQAYCDVFIRALPHGYGTFIGERGAILSGGQRRRLGLARAFLKNSPIFERDETTSTLYSQTESIIPTAPTALMRGRTVVAIVHRLSTLANLGRLVILHEGQIVEDGISEDLIKRDGPFKALWKAQAVASHRT